MHVAVFPIINIRVRPPDSFQHFDAQTERLNRALEAQTGVPPRLPEVAVH